MPVHRFFSDCLECGTSKHAAAGWFLRFLHRGIRPHRRKRHVPKRPAGGYCPDLETFAVVPWDRGQETATARFICDVFAGQGRPFARDPRQVLRRALGEAKKIPLFIFKAQPDGIIAAKPHDRAGCFDVSTDVATSIRKRKDRKRT
ncbi:MAG: hypothetical protein NTV33_00180 [Coprothermobacterota bacterium]|nr:hypothetical protein [Coprothermobacterota bacterium]